MAHGNQKKEASDGVRRSKCERAAELRLFLEDEAKDLVATDLPVLSIVRKLDDLAKQYRTESQGRR